MSLHLDSIDQSTLNRLIGKSLDLSVKIKKFMHTYSVVPTATFFRNEAVDRYKNILPHLYGDGSAMARLRETLQNSNDSGSTEFSVSAMVFDDETQLEKLQATGLFVRWQDNGCWKDGKGIRSTFDMVKNSFLSMDGSTKGAGLDGGFGVGRFIIVFCAPFWLMTTENLLVIGNYNQFLICCRTCLEEVVGPCCDGCKTTASDFPTGTSIMVNYPDLKTRRGLDNYIITCSEHYLPFCNLPKLTIRLTLLDGRVVTTPPYKPDSIIHKGDNFDVYKLKTDDTPDRPVYMVCTAGGVPMFSKVLYTGGAENGYFLVTLKPVVTYTDFDQSRAMLSGRVGRELSTFLSDQSTKVGSHDIDQDSHMYVRSRNDPLDLLNIETFQCSGTGVHDATDDDKNDMGGPLEFQLFFRDGFNMDNIADEFKPATLSCKAVALLLSWTVCIHEAFEASELLMGHFSVGFVFSGSTRAMMLGNTFFINPTMVEDECDGIDVTNHAVVGSLAGCAAHEICHQVYQGHDGGFASMHTSVVQKMLGKHLKNNADTLIRSCKKTNAVAKTVVRLKRRRRKVCRRVKKTTVILIEDSDSDSDTPPAQRMKMSEISS